MKRILFLVLCLFLLTGCNASGVSDDITQAPTITDTTEAITENDMQMLSVSVPVTIKTYYTDDNTALFTSAQQHMQLILADKVAADRIILDFLNRVDRMQRETEDILLSAQRDYFDNTYWIPYNQQIIYNPMRVDHGVVSLFGVNSSYTGGIHSTQRAISANYDVATGDVLTFASIMHLDANQDDFIQLVLDDLRTHAEDYYLFDDFEETVQSLMGGDPTQYQDFYFTSDGLVFFFSPYDLAPYASGIITAKIPYSQLTGLLYNGYFPDEQDNGIGKIHTEDFQDADIEEFTSIEEIMIDDADNLIVIYPDAKVSDVRVIISENGVIPPSYTVFAAPEMDENTALVLGISSINTPAVTIHYRSNGQEFEVDI